MRNPQVRNTRPRAVVVHETSESLRIRARDIRWVMLASDLAIAVCVSPAVAMGVRLVTVPVGTPGFLVGMSLCALLGLLAIIRHAVSLVHIEVARGGALDVREGLSRRQGIRLRAEDVTQVFCMEHSWLENTKQRRLGREGSRGKRIRGVRLMAKTKDGRDHVLAGGLLSHHSARCIEAELESFLGIKDIGIVGELPKQSG